MSKLVVKTVPDLPARLYGGNAQEVEVRGLDYTLHLDLEKLPESEAPTSNDGKWTVVWDEAANQYKRVEFTALPGSVGPPGVSGPQGPVGPQGMPGPVGPQGGVVGPGHIGGLANVSNSRAEAILTEFDADVKVVQLLGANTPGDAGPPMPCKRTNGPVTVHKGWFRSVDRFKLDGTTDATNGGYWEYIGTNAAIAVEWFGAKADYLLTPPGRDGISTVNPTPTDSWQAIMDASNFLVVSIRHVITPGTHYGWSTGPTIQFGLGAYYISETIMFGISVGMQGVGGGMYHDNAGTRIYVAPGKSAFQFQSAASPINSGASNSGAFLRDIYISATGAKVPGVHGIRMQGGVYIEHCMVTSFGGNGISIEADVNGGTNANCFYLNHVFCFDNGGDGVYCVGGDSNAGSGFALNCMHNGGYGVNDRSFLGNTWVGCHFDGNLAGPYYLEGINNRAAAFGNYCEGNQPPAYVGPNAISIGGFQASGIHPESKGIVFADNGISPHRIVYRGEGHATDRLTLDIRPGPNIISSASVDGGFGHKWACDADLGMFSWRWGDVNDGALWAYTITTEQRLRPYGRTEGVRQGNVAFPKGIYLGGEPVGIDNPRYFGTTDHYISQFVYGPGFSRSPGPYAKGDTLLNYRAAEGFGDHWGEYCVVAGAHCPNVWASGTDYAAPDYYQRGGSYVKNSAGKIYRCVVDPGAVPSTVEPVHASGDVTGADGYGWRWLANGEAVFKPFAPLMGLGSTTVNDPLFNLTQTWNNAAVTFVGHTTNIIDTASHANSVLQEWRVGGVQKAAIRKDGTFLSNGTPVLFEEMIAKIDALQARVAALEAAP